MKSDSSCSLICNTANQSDDGNSDRVVWQSVSENGRFTMTEHQVFPGISLLYLDAHTESVSFGDRDTVSDRIFEISHCREGRLECSIGGDYCYLTPGDLSIARTGSISASTYFPLRHYHGITIRIDIDRAPRCLSCFLDDVKVQPNAIAEKFCGENGGFVAHSNPAFTHLFSELYSVPEGIQKGYFKIKVLELLLFLSVLEIDREPRQNMLSRAQVSLAKEVSRYLLSHMDDRITLAALAEQFHVSGTHIKTCFKGVYGVSLYAFIRTQKMESAAYMLEYTDLSILEIAGAHGYDNGSKFAGAFRDIKGMAPNEYRTQYRKQHTATQPANPM